MSALEKHYSVQEISDKWKLSPDTIRKLFHDEQGVVRIGRPESRFKRQYFILRVPESVLLRVHARIAARK